MRRRHVLVVEDDPEISETVRDVLEAEGFSVEVALNGQEALEKLRDGCPCVVLLDLMMPVMSGWEFAEHIQSDTLLAAIPIVVTTAWAADAPKTARAVVRKPYDLNALLEQVDRFCQRCARQDDLPAAMN